MRIFFLRHGTRDFTYGDVPLNDEGLREAEGLASRPELQGVEAIFCSPKQRAQMTVDPLAQRLQLKVQVDRSLDQRQTGESGSDFVTRVSQWLEQQPLEKSSVICSHSDWLSIALQVIPTDSLDLHHHMFQCAEVMGFRIVEGLWQRLEK